MNASTILPAQEPRIAQRKGRQAQGLMTDTVSRRRKAEKTADTTQRRRNRNEAQYTTTNSNSANANQGTHPMPDMLRLRSRLDSAKEPRRSCWSASCALRTREGAKIS
jgi:hypothetical protein